jgi:hypothetical protein
VSGTRCCAFQQLSSQAFLTSERWPPSPPFSPPMPAPARKILAVLRSNLDKSPFLASPHRNISLDPLLIPASMSSHNLLSPLFKLLPHPNFSAICHPTRLNLRGRFSTVTANVTSTRTAFRSRSLISSSRTLDFSVWHCSGIDQSAQRSPRGLKPIEEAFMLCGISERKMQATNWMEL